MSVSDYLLTIPMYRRVQEKLDRISASRSKKLISGVRDSCI